MKNKILILAVFLVSLFSSPVFSQNNAEPEALGLPGDNLNLNAVLDIFQKSQTIEDFEKSLNAADTKINNLDLDNDEKVDFIKVKTEKDGDNFMFVLQVELSKKDIQDIAVIFVNKDKNKKVSIQIVGDENLYGKDYVVEPVSSNNASNTLNPGYTGNEPVTSSTVKFVNVATSPIVVYVYSPVYVPYYPPYYYGYYPSYYNPWAPIFFSVYYHNHYHYHNHYYRPPYRPYPVHYNHYYSRRSTSVLVVNNTRNGNYKRTYNGNSFKKPLNPTTRPTTSRPTRPVTRPTTPTTRPTTRPVTRPTTPTTRPVARPTMPTTRPVTRPTAPSKGSNRQVTPSTSRN